jgi:hypothetical protein
VRQAPGLDAGRAPSDARVVERGDERGAQLARGIGRCAKVVRPVGDDPCSGGSNIGRVEVGDDENRLLRPDAEEHGNGDERIRDGPIFNRRLEAADVRKRLRVGEDGLRAADLVEGGTHAVEQLGRPHAQKSRRSRRPGTKRRVRTASGVLVSITGTVRVSHARKKTSADGGTRRESRQERRAGRARCDLALPRRLSPLREVERHGFIPAGWSRLAPIGENRALTGERRARDVRADARRP